MCLVAKSDSWPWVLWQFPHYQGALVLFLCFRCALVTGQSSHFQPLCLWLRLAQGSLVTNVYSRCSSARSAQLGGESRCTSPHVVLCISLSSQPKQHRLHPSLWSPYSLWQVSPHSPARPDPSICHVDPGPVWKGAPQVPCCSPTSQSLIFLADGHSHVGIWWPERRLLSRIPNGRSRRCPQLLSLSPPLPWVSGCWGASTSSLSDSFPRPPGFSFIPSMSHPLPPYRRRQKNYPSYTWENSKGR